MTWRMHCGMRVDLRAGHASNGGSAFSFGRRLFVVGKTHPSDQREGTHRENGDQGRSAEDVPDIPHCATWIGRRGGWSAQEEQVASGANGIEKNGQLRVAERRIEDCRTTPQIERE